MKRFLYILVFLMPVTCLGQYTLTGRIVDSASKKPLANASVFLNNAVAGGTSAENGTFTLTNVRPGQYDLVISCVGYETAHRNIIVNSDLKLGDLAVSVKTMMLQEVRIKSKNNWKRDYEMFKRFFFGTSGYASQCRIINKDLPDILDLDYDRTAGVFTAKSNAYMVIENKALGYEIRYYLNELKVDEYRYTSYYAGTAAFGEMKGSESDRRRWQKHREEAYYGSSMHFLRAVIANNFTQEGFKVLRIGKKKSFGGMQPLVNKPLAVGEFVKLTDVAGEYALSFDDNLYVLYYKKIRKASQQDKAKFFAGSGNLGDPLTTTVYFNEPNAFFDANGILINPFSVSFNGNWGARLIAELLPVDYVPPKD